MATRDLAAGVSGFLQAFSAVDAAGSRRRRERMLEARLEEERQFRQAKLEMSQAAEARAQQAFDETIEARDSRIAGDRLAFDPNATNDQLRQFAPFSQAAAAELERRITQGRGVAFLGEFADAQLAQQQATLAQPGATAEEPAPTATEQPGLQAGVAGIPVAPLPGDEFALREIPVDEIERQTGVTIEPPGPTGLGRERLAGVPKTGPATVAMPSDFKSLGELEAMARADPSRRAEAQAIRDRQKAELLEADPRTVAGVREEAKAKRDQINNEWKAANSVTDPTGDSLRRLSETSPSAVVAKFWDDFNNLDKDVREDAVKWMQPVVKKSMAEQRLVLDDPETDPDSRDARIARRKYSRGLGVNQAIVGDYKPGKEAGVNAQGIPNNANGEQLAADMTANMTSPSAPSSEATLPPDKQRQIQSQLIRNTANPTARATEAQLKNLYQGVQMGIITPQQAQWAAWHGGALPGPVPEHITLGKDQSLWARIGNEYKLVHSPLGTGNDMRNDLDATTLARIGDHFSQFNTDDDDKRGTRYEGEFLAFMRRTENLANQAGVDFSSPADVSALAQRFSEEMIFKSQFEDQLFQGFDINPEYADHFGDFDRQIYGLAPQRAGRSGFRTAEEFLRAEQQEIFPDVTAQVRPFPGRTTAVDVAGFRQAVAQSGDRALIAQVDQMSNAQLEAALIAQARAEQGVQ